MNPELKHHIRSLTRLIYVVTDEEDRFIRDFQSTLKKQESRTWVYNGALGLQPINTLVKDWGSREHQVNTQAGDIHNALIQIYKDDPKEEQNFYLITDAERWLRDEHVVRRVTNIIHQLHSNVRIVKLLIFIGSRKAIPAKLARYFEVVVDTGLTSDETSETVKYLADMLKVEVPANPEKLFKGMTSYEIDGAITQSCTLTGAKDKDGKQGHKRIDPVFIQNFRRKQIEKTDLLQYVDTSNFDLSQVGGLQRFKQWATETKSTFSEEGSAFGLVPPRGLLLVGVYGCGKSLSTKALSRLWNLPLIQLEIGKLMASGVGESEGNLYKALNLIEAVSPCIVWIDEAEKSLAGGQSSGRSDAGTTSRVLGILSTWIQETKSQVTLALTANSLKTLPVEITNRMDERFFFDIPSEQDRIEIIKIQIKNRKQNPEKFNLADLATAASGMVGREMDQAVSQAMTLSFNAKKPGLDQSILEECFRKKPRIIKTMGDDIREIVEWVGFDPEANDGIRARLASDRVPEKFTVVEGGI